MRQVMCSQGLIAVLHDAVVQEMLADVIRAPARVERFDAWPFQTSSQTLVPPADD